MKVANKQFDEILSEVNSSDDVQAALKVIINQPWIKFYLSQLTSEDWPDFDVNEVKFTQHNYHRSMAGALLLNKQTANIYKVIFMSNEVPLKTKQHQCKALLEMLCKGESDILRVLLTKNLQLIYPNITYNIINSVL